METTPVTIRIDNKLLERFDKVAEQLGYHRAEAVREAIRRFIKNFEKNAKR